MGFEELLLEDEGEKFVMIPLNVIFTKQQQQQQQQARHTNSKAPLPLLGDSKCQ